MQIEYIGFGGCSGTGIAAKDYMLALDKAGIDIVFRPVDSLISKWYTPEEQVKLRKLSNKEITSKNVIQIFHFIPDKQRRYAYKRRDKTVGFATFESNTIPSHWLKYLSSNNLVVVPSQFCYDTFSNKDLNLVKIPHCINIDDWNPVRKEVNKVFTFCAIGSWRSRKGWEELCSAWEGMTNCHLKIVTDLKEKAVMKFNKFKNVSVHTKVQDMVKFMNDCDAVVCPTLGEGFGYVGLQALALELPLVITDWSGVKEYANNSVANMIPVEGTKPKAVMDNIFQFRECEWASISPDILRVKMQEVQNNYTFFKKKAQRGRQIVSDMLSYVPVGNRFKEALQGM